MTGGTTATSFVPVEDTSATAAPRWMNVVFLQGEEADAVLDMIEQVGPGMAIHHLSQWDYGDETRDAALVNGYVYNEIPQTPTDHVIGDKRPLSLRRAGVSPLSHRIPHRPGSPDR